MTSTPDAGSPLTRPDHEVASRPVAPTDSPESESPEPELPLGVTEGPPRQVGNNGRRRALAYAATVALLIVINFALPRVMPGDPITAMTARAAAGGSQATVPDEEAREALESYYGLDESLAGQFTSYVTGLATGDLGMSISEREPVAGLLARRLPWTLLLMGTAMAMAVALGLLLGIHSGWRSGRRGDWGLLSVVTAIRQIPPFFLAPVALLFFSATLGWVPLGGAATPFASELGLVERVLDVAHHLLLPAGVLALQLTAATYLFMRGAMLGELGAGYLLLGRAKGVPDSRLKYRYAARNALLPVVSLTALQLAFATTGSIFIETVFSYPGVGRLIFDAVNAHDYPVVQGGFLVLSLTVVTANYGADLLYARLDPRVSR